MDTSDPIRNVSNARAALERARVALVESMRTAEVLGATQRDIAAAARVSQGEVWKVLRRGKRIS